MIADSEFRVTRSIAAYARAAGNVQISDLLSQRLQVVLQENKCGMD